MKLLTVLPLLAVLSCCSHQTCITPPPMSTEEQNNVATSIAAQLAGAPATGNLSISYSNIVKDTFDKLQDSDKALYLFLLAIECYLNEGNVGETIAKGMAQTVQAKWGSKQGPATARRIPLDQRSPDVAPRIHAILKRVGLDVQ